MNGERLCRRASNRALKIDVAYLHARDAATGSPRSDALDSEACRTVSSTPSCLSHYSCRESLVHMRVRNLRQQRHRFIAGTMTRLANTAHAVPIIG